MALPLIDTFTGTDGDPLNATNHPSVGSGIDINGNRARCISPASAYAGTSFTSNSDTAVLDYDCYIDMPDLDALLLSIRHYRPRVGAFVSRDPVRTELTYGYVRGMPGPGVDPTGLVRDPYVKGCSPTETAAILDAWREGCRRVEAGCLGSYFSGSFRACLERECRNGMRPFGILCRPKWYPECWPNIAARAYPCLDIVVCRDWGGSTIVYTELILHELAHHCGALEGGAMLPSAECVEALCFPGGPVPSGCSRHPAPWYKCAASWLVRPGLCYL